MWLACLRLGMYPPHKTRAFQICCAPFEDLVTTEPVAVRVIYADHISACSIFSFYRCLFPQPKVRRASRGPHSEATCCIAQLARNSVAREDKKPTRHLSMKKSSRQEARHLTRPCNALVLPHGRRATLRRSSLRRSSHIVTTFGVRLKTEAGGTTKTESVI